MQSQASGESGDLTFRIQEMESRLEEMLLRFTEKHPEVIAVKSTIDELKKKQQEEIARVQAGQRATGSMASSLKSNPVYQGIETELKRVEVQLAEIAGGSLRSAPRESPTCNVWSIRCPRSRRSSRA